MLTLTVSFTILTSMRINLLPPISASDSMVLNYIVSNGICFDTASNIKINPLPDIQAIHDTIVCPDQIVSVKKEDPTQTAYFGATAAIVRKETFPHQVLINIQLQINLVLCQRYIPHRHPTTTKNTWTLTSILSRKQHLSP